MPARSWKGEGRKSPKPGPTMDDYITYSEPNMLDLIGNPLRTSLDAGLTRSILLA